MITQIMILTLIQLSKNFFTIVSQRSFVYVYEEHAEMRSTTAKYKWTINSEEIINKKQLLLALL